MRSPQSFGPPQSDQLERQIAHCHGLAKDAAERGEISAAAKLILTALDHERRLAARSPQVLQLIKPRG
ncbi:MAG: hypothetical protein FJ050_02805 [Cyanobacteria bacterium M_surface_7_m2_040]|nr:hypothetical protein [Cyanobacteria bacterium M_surface_9_m1_291]MBM5826975.1 hypothetical protein [Cyanobacteria bacterium M_surface_7_m2_040]